MMKGKMTGGANKGPPDPNTYVRSMIAVRRRKSQWDSQLIDWLVAERRAGRSPQRSRAIAIAWWKTYLYEVVDGKWLMKEIRFLQLNGIHPDASINFLRRIEQKVMMEETHRLLLGGVQNIGILAGSIGDHEAGNRSRPEAIGKLSSAIVNEKEL
jgi:hypothetical protein